MKNKYHEDFWKVKDPSRISKDPIIKDTLGYEDTNTESITNAQGVISTDN